jgi:hypothetical protein
MILKKRAAYERLVFISEAISHNAYLIPHISLFTIIHKGNKNNRGVRPRLFLLLHG